MSRFREFPYKGSLLQSQNGTVQEVSTAPESSLPTPTSPHQHGRIMDQNQSILPDLMIRTVFDL